MAAGKTKTICLLGKTIQVGVKEEEQTEVEVVPAVRTKQGGMKRYVPFLMTSKKLTDHDCSIVRGRLSVPNCSQLYDRLTSEERIAASKQGIPVFAADNRRMKYRLNLVKRPNSNRLVINRGWSDVIRRNRLKECVEMELWCFREKGNLCFGLIFNNKIKIEHRDKLLPPKKRYQLLT